MQMNGRVFLPGRPPEPAAAADKRCLALPPPVCYNLYGAVSENGRGARPRRKERQTMKKLWASLLAVLIAAGACVLPISARDTNIFAYFPLEVPAAALTQGAPDDAALSAALDAFAAAVRAGTATDREMAALFYAADSAEARLQTAGTVCMLNYDRDPDAYRSAYLAWTAMDAKDASRSTAVLQAALASKYRTVLRQILGDDQADALLRQTADTPAQVGLLAKCDALVSRCWTGIGAAYTAAVGGGSYTAAQLAQGLRDGTLTRSQYQDGLLQLAKQKNAAVAPLLASLVTLRNQYARSKGCRNYAEYAYSNIYQRDFTTADAAALETRVKQELVPVAMLCGEIQSHNGDLSEDRLHALTNLSQQQMLDLVGASMSDVSGEYARLFSYMRRDRLCDIGPSAKKLEVGFTVALGEYHSAYIFSRADGTARDLMTLIHEFGHYAQCCLDDREAWSCDTAEINSQGLEALYLRFADRFAGADGGDAFRAKTENELLDGIVSGCLYDEFQQQLYADGSLTPDEMNRLFCRLAGEYGLSSAADSGMAYDWVDVSHTFANPFYDLSYATSACTALELLAQSAGRYGAAADKYLQLTADSGDCAYRALIAKEGLTDIFAPGGVQKIAAGALRYMEREAADVPAYTDLAGHWFADGAGLISADGIMRGSGTRFAPDEKTTRAMLVIVLYRLCNPAGADCPAVFRDVTDPAAWYYDAVNWAAAQGYVTGGGGEFRPDDPITRQDMAVILARAVLGGAAADDGVLDRYADRARISADAGDAVALVTAADLMQGSGGAFRPLGTATRAELGQIALRLIR